MVFLSGLDNSINGRLIRFAGEDLRWASRAIGFVGYLRVAASGEASPTLGHAMQIFLCSWTEKTISF